METQLTRFGKTGYSVSAAAYQPSQDQLRRTLTLVALLLIVLLIGLATQARAQGNPSDYPVLKGGYASSLSHDRGNFNGGSTRQLDSRLGFAGELA